MDRAGTLARLARRWLPGRELVLVADGGFAAVGLGHACRRAGVTLVTRCRTDIALYDPPAPKDLRRRDRSPAKGPRQPPLAMRWVLARDPAGDRRPLTLCCTDPAACPLRVLAWHLSRWNIEITFEELRAWLRAETQRGWCLLTTQRSTPCLFGLFSIVALSAHALHPDRLPARAAAWYAKDEPTFADALASVRCAPWAAGNSRTRADAIDAPLFPRDFLASLMDAAAYAA